MASPVEIGTLIERIPGHCGGRPKIARTRITVSRVAAMHKSGMTAEEIVETYGHLSLAQVHAALAYYHANPEEIETDLAEEDALADRLAEEARQRPS